VRKYTRKTLEHIVIDFAVRLAYLGTSRAPLGVYCLHRFHCASCRQLLFLCLLSHHAQNINTKFERVFLHNRATLAPAIRRSKRNVRAIIRTISGTRMRSKSQVTFSRFTNVFGVRRVCCGSRRRHLAVVIKELLMMADGTRARRVLPNLALYSPPKWNYCTLQADQALGPGLCLGKLVPRTCVGSLWRAGLAKPIA
jgi:hypothetical protein